ncbi:MAG: hypothetical protein IPK58_09925 [Acidobacteria bacterium]|nr:hypothetical protein [Acidobacteriota bacterium]
MNEKSFEHGAEWVRADFHLHTDADGEFRYSGDPKFYNSAYVDALGNAGIRLGVITNHNKLDAVEFKALRSTAKKQGISLLPGVELSVGDGAKGVHTLIVFSDQWLSNTENHINPFLNSVFTGRTPDQYECENGRSQMSLLQAIHRLDDYHKDYFLVFAHVEQPCGIWKELDGGRLTELAKNELLTQRTLGFQKVRTHDGAKKCQMSDKGPTMDG